MKKNILFLVVDCLRSDRLFSKDRTCKTPHLDSLIERSVSLPNVFVENSITAPSFASMFTGRYSANHRVTGMVGVKLDQELVTLAEVMGQSGYTTYAEVTGPLAPLLGLDKGFEHYNYRNQQDYCHSPFGETLVDKLREKQLEDPFFMLVHFWELHEPRQVPEAFDNQTYGATSYDRAVSALDDYLGKLLDASGDNTTIILTGDHGECVGELPPQDTLLPYFLQRLDLPSVDQPSNHGIDAVTDLIVSEPRLHQMARELQSMKDRTDKARMGIGTRLKMIVKLLRIGLSRYKLQIKKGRQKSFFTNVKQKLGDLRLFFAVLLGRPNAARRQLLRASLGEHALQHGYHIYDYLQRVPLVISGVIDGKAGLKISADVRHIDLLPSLIELFALESPDDCSFDGSSYASYFATGEGPDRAILLEARSGAPAEEHFFIRGVRRGQHKIAFAPNHSDAPTEFYCLQDDSGEKFNRYEQEPDQANRLREEAQALAASFNTDGDAHLNHAENKEMMRRLKSLGYM